MESIYTKIVEIQQKGISAALCTIIQSTGSTPRKTGSKMLVYANGSIFGTIGGGTLELLVMQQALKLLKIYQAGTFNFELDKDASMSCGGSARVFIEPLELRKKLLIFGAGHIGSVLAEMAVKLNFSVTLIDDRENIMATNENSEINWVNMNFDAALKELDYDKNTYVAIATYKHKIDKLIVGFCAKKDLAYVGMVGSRKKITALKKELMDEKTLTPKEFDKVNTPIGVGIKCETPQEIAVSILAKMIDVRNAELV